MGILFEISSWILLGIPYGIISGTPSGIPLGALPEISPGNRSGILLLVLPSEIALWYFPLDSFRDFSRFFFPSDIHEIQGAAFRESLNESNLNSSRNFSGNSISDSTKSSWIPLGVPLEIFLGTRL